MAADAENTPELFSGNVTLVNASLTYSAPGDSWSLAVGGNNVFNKRYIANGVNQLNGAGLLSAVPNRPSEYYATLRFKFCSAQTDLSRSEERRVGNGCFSTCRFRWSACPSKTKPITTH